MWLRRLLVFVAAALLPLVVAGVYLVGQGVVGAVRPEASPATSTPPGPTPANGTASTRDPVGGGAHTRAPSDQSPASPSATQAPVVTPDRSTVADGEARGIRYVFPIRDCAASYAATHHNYPAADIFTARGCTFVAPVAGRVSYVSRADRWEPSTNAGADRGGLSVAIIGVDGVQYYGSHLARVDAGIVPGQRVRTGQPLGVVGESGSARGTGAHLHFGISWPTSTTHWWIRRGTVAPQPFLDRWRQGKNSNPAPRVEAARRAHGDDSRCRAYC
jgi:peptidoglycan LD-endopeptidase LytH